MIRPAFHGRPSIFQRMLRNWHTSREGEEGGMSCQALLDNWACGHRGLDRWFIAWLPHWGLWCQTGANRPHSLVTESRQLVFKISFWNFFLSSLPSSTETFLHDCEYIILQNRYINQTVMDNKRQLYFKTIHYIYHLTVY